MVTDLVLYFRGPIVRERGGFERGRTEPDPVPCRGLKPKLAHLAAILRTRSRPVEPPPPSAVSGLRGCPLFLRMLVSLERGELGPGDEEESK